MCLVVRFRSSPALDSRGILLNIQWLDIQQIACPMSPGSAANRLVRQIADSVPARPPTVRFGADVAPVRNTPPALIRRLYQISGTMVADSLAGAQLTPLQMAAIACLNRGDG